VKKSLLSLALLTSLSGCSMIPDYLRPYLPVDSTYVRESEHSQPIDIAWREFFRDPALRQLISRALENNRDLRAAALNVEAYREQFRVQRSERFPQVSLNGVSSRRRLPAMTSGGSSGSGAGSGGSSDNGGSSSNSGSSYIGSGNNSSGGTISSWYSVTLGLAWEMDMFGRLSSLEEQALQTYFASESGRRSTQVSLVASVANTWLSWRANLAQLQLAKDTLKAYEQTLTLTQARLDAGVASAMEVSQARSSVESTRASMERYSREVELDQNALTLLVGQKIPANLAPDWKAEKPLLASFAVGIPSDLLLQRPDIVEAEQQLRGANANIGAARAAFFPSINLTSAAGTASNEVSELFKGGSGYWEFIPRISIPIFTSGQLEASLSYAKLSKDIRIAQYEKAIQTAFSEVNDGLAARTTYVRQVQARHDLVKANQDYYSLAERRYRAGVDNYLTLLDAQRELYVVQQELITDRLDQQVSEVNLFKALGGGWQQDAFGRPVVAP